MHFFPKEAPENLAVSDSHSPLRFLCIFAESDIGFGRGSNVMTELSKPGVPKLLSPHEPSVWTCVSHECVSHVLLGGFWSGVRSGMETHRRGRLSKQCGHGEGHCSVFRVEQQVVQCTERVPLLSYISSLPQVLLYLSFSLFQRRGVLLWVGPWEAGLSEPFGAACVIFPLPFCH